MLSVTRTVSFVRGPRGRERLTDQPPVDPPPAAARIPRIARLMALALRFEELVRSGEVADRGALARAARVTESRVTQVLGMCRLAPEIQAELLFWPATERGRERVCEKHLRAVWREPDFAHQRAAWAAMKERAAGGRVCETWRFGTPLIPKTATKSSEAQRPQGRPAGRGRPPES